jgi:hypothetical protein
MVGLRVKIRFVFLLSLKTDCESSVAWPSNNRLSLALLLLLDLIHAFKRVLKQM